MADAFPGLVKGVTVTSGTGTYTVTVATGVPYRSLAQAVADGSLADGDTVNYVAWDTTVLGDASFEAGEGIFNVGGGPTYTVTRATIHDSSNGPGTPVSWGLSGQRDFYIRAVDPSVMARIDRENTFAQNQLVSHGANPQLIVSEDVSYPLVLLDNSSAVAQLKKTGNGATLLRLDAQPDNGTSDATLQIFRDSSTSGTRRVNLYKGDGTGTITAFLDADTGNVDTEGALDVALGAVLNSDQGDNDVRVKSSSADDLLFADAGNNALGVGTDTPQAGALDVNKTLVVRGSVSLNDDAGDLDVTVKAQTSGTALFVDVSSSRLVIGNNSAQADLHIAKTGTSTLQVGGLGTTQRALISSAPSSGSLTLAQVNTGVSDIYLDPLSGASSNCGVHLFRNSNTSGNLTFSIHVGDGSATALFLVDAATGTLLADGELRMAFTSGEALQVVGWKSTAADPTTTEFPNDHDFGIHENTSSGDVFLTVNDGGSILKVILA